MRESKKAVEHAGIALEGGRDPPLAKAPGVLLAIIAERIAFRGDHERRWKIPEIGPEDRGERVVGIGGTVDVVRSVPRHVRRGESVAFRELLV